MGESTEFQISRKCLGPIFFKPPALVGKGDKRAGTSQRPGSCFRIPADPPVSTLGSFWPCLQLHASWLRSRDKQTTLRECLSLLSSKQRPLERQEGLAISRKALGQSDALVGRNRCTKSRMSTSTSHQHQLLSCCVFSAHRQRG